jgi:hypothetical protein
VPGCPTRPGRADQAHLDVTRDPQPQAGSARPSTVPDRNSRLAPAGWRPSGRSAAPNRFDAALGGIGGCPFAPGAAGNVATDDLVNLCHREGVATGVDGVRLGELRDELAIAVGHRLGSALAAVPAVPAALRIEPVNRA